MESLEDLKSRIDAYRDGSNLEKFHFAIAPAAEIGIKTLLGSILEEDGTDYERASSLLLIDNLEAEIMGHSTILERAEELINSVSMVRGLGIAKKLNDRFKGAAQEEVDKRKKTLSDADVYLDLADSFLDTLITLRDAVKS